MELSPRTKRLILIALLVIVIGLVGYAIYYVFFRPFVVNDNNVVNNTNTVNNGGVLPSTNTNRIVTNQNTNIATNGNVNAELPPIADVADGGLTKVNSVSDTSVYLGAPTADNSGYVYYDDDLNKFYRVSSNGDKVELSEEEFYNVDNVAWSPDRDQAVISYPDGSNIYHNFQTNQSVTLPKEIDEISFSDSGDKIAYEFLGSTDNEKWLGISNPDGSGQQIIQGLGDNEDRVDINWSPDAQVVATFREGVGIDEEEIYFIGQYGENFKSIRVEGAGFTGKWSPLGDKLLYSIYNSESDYKPTLWIVDARGDATGLNNVSLGVNTWPDKCVFSGSSLYCAVPTELPEGAGLAPEVARYSKDNIYEINLETGQRNLLAIPYVGANEPSYGIEDLYISSDGATLYFRNTYTGLLEQIKIK